MPIASFLTERPGVRYQTSFHRLLLFFVFQIHRNTVYQLNKTLVLLWILSITDVFEEIWHIIMEKGK